MNERVFPIETREQIAFVMKNAHVQHCRSQRGCRVSGVRKNFDEADLLSGVKERPREVSARPSGISKLRSGQAALAARSSVSIARR